MARRPIEDSPERGWTPDTIRSALKKLRRRLTEVQGFEPQTVTRRFDPTVTALETSIRETLADVYGRNSSSFRNYQLAASIDAARHNANGVPHHEVIEGLAHGKERSIQLLSAAIRSLEEKMEDDFPGEPLDQVALSGRSAVAAMGGAGLRVRGGGVPVRRVGLLDEDEAAFEVERLPSETGRSQETQYTELQARLALLESSVDQLRRELGAPREIGMGHNQGPAFAPVPVEELDEVDNLIALLKEQGPTPPQDPTPLIGQSQKVARVSCQIKQYLDGFAIEAFKGAGGEIGKRLAQAPFWIAVYHGIDRVTEALALWLTHAPQ